MKFIADFHVHSLRSGHSFGTVQEIAENASDKGLEYIAITDHGPNITGAPTELYFHCPHFCPHKIKNTKILFGCESNIIDIDGRIDLSTKTASQLDILLAGFHNHTDYIPSTEKENTKTLLNCIKNNPDIDIISHIENPQFKVNYTDIIKCLNDYNTILEINNRSLLPDHLCARSGSTNNCIEIIHLCEKHNINIVVSSDSHNQFQVGCFDYAVKLLKQENFPENLIINIDSDKTKKFVDSIHKNKLPKEILK